MRAVHLVILFVVLIACGPDLTPVPGPIVQLSHTATPSQTFLNNGKCVAVDGSGRVHVVWMETLVPGPAPDSLAEQGQLFHSRSVDGGATFSAPVAITNVVSKLWPPKIVALGESLFAVWHQQDGDRIKIFFARSDDGGDSWSSLPNALGPGAFPALDAVDDAGTTRVHVVWVDPQRPASEIFLASSTDGGRSFSPPLMVSEDDGHSSWTPTVAAAGPLVHVAWTDERDNIDENGQLLDCGMGPSGTRDCREEEYYRRSTDGGLSFPEPTQRLTQDPAGRPQPSWCPSMVAQGSDVHLTYFDYRSGSWEIYHRRSRDGGRSWEAESSVTQLLGKNPDWYWLRPSLSGQGETLQLTFWRQTSDSETVWATSSVNGGASWSAARPLSANRHALHPAVTIAKDGTPHYAWYEQTDGNPEMFYRHLDPVR